MGRKKKSEERLAYEIAVRLNKDEYETLRKSFENSTSWSMSQYCRKILTGRPVVIFYRDQSLDAFIQEAISLRNQLQRIDTLTYEGKEELTRVVGAIKICINKIYDYVREHTTK